jgi:hypothetical protein
VKRVLNTSGYTLLNFRYGSLILPTGVVAYLLDVPAWATAVALVLLAAAFATEVVTSVLNGVHTATLVHQQQHDEQVMWDEMARYANGGWVGLDGSEDAPEGQAPDEGEGEDPGEEGFRSVR